MKARPKPDERWAKNALTGEEVSREVDWLIDRLAALNPLAAKDRPRVVDRADAVPLIEAALARLEAQPAAERRKRQSDALAADVVRAVRIAHRVMVHRSKILHGNGLARLGREINERFRCDFIF